MTNLTMVQRIEHWPVEKLRAYPRNARVHNHQQFQQIAASTKEFGVVTPVLIDPDGTIIAGHVRAAEGDRLSAEQLQAGSVLLVRV